MFSGEIRANPPDGREAKTIHFEVGYCSLGSILVAATGKGVGLVSLADGVGAVLAHLRERFPSARPIHGDQRHKGWMTTVVGQVERPAMSASLPLDIEGTAFQKQVWEALRAVPVGTTVTYSDIAEKIGRPRASRAVASACGQNPLAVVIPCHRVVRKGGGLGGYRWGVDRKHRLLKREGVFG